MSDLDWESGDLSEEITFMYLEISIKIELKNVEHKVHVKKEALALHIPPYSAHPPITPRGMVLAY